MAGAFAIARWRRRFLFRYFFAGVTVYSGWELKDWSSVERLLADSFTFTSLVDDHIGKQAFHDRCWAQAAHIKHFDLESVAAAGDSDGFVKYRCHTIKGTSFRNIEARSFAALRMTANRVRPPPPTALRPTPPSAPPAREG